MVRLICKHSAAHCVSLIFYHILTSSMIYYREDAKQRGNVFCRSSLPAFRKVSHPVKHMLEWPTFSEWISNRLENTRSFTSTVQVHTFSIPLFNLLIVPLLSVS